MATRQVFLCCWKQWEGSRVLSDGNPLGWMVPSRSTANYKKSAWKKKIHCMGFLFFVFFFQFDIRFFWSSIAIFPFNRSKHCEPAKENSSSPVSDKTAHSYSSSSPNWSDVFRESLPGMEAAAIVSQIYLTACPWRCWKISHPALSHLLSLHEPLCKDKEPHLGRGSALGKRSPFPHRSVSATPSPHDCTHACAATRQGAGWATEDTKGTG